MCLSRRYNYMIHKDFEKGKYTWRIKKLFKANWKCDKSLPNNWTTCGGDEYGYFIPKNVDSPLAKIYEKKVLRRNIS